MAYGSFIIGGGGNIPRIGQVIVTTLKDDSPAKRYKNTTWELVAQNRVPMGAGDGHEGGETVEAGLPNITGTFAHGNSIDSSWSKVIYAGGCFKYEKLGAVSIYQINSVENGSPVSIEFKASNSSKIYGASDTVQPPAYYFYFWRRVS